MLGPKFSCRLASSPIRPISGSGSRIAPRTAACRDAKVEAFRFHDLRHTFASHFTMSTGDLPSLQKILDHVTLVMTIRHAHWPQGHVRTAMARVRL